MALKPYSKAILEGVDRRLLATAHRVAEKFDFAIYEGMRTESRQQYLFNKGYSKTLRSKHLIGMAIDIYPYVHGKPSKIIHDKKHPEFDKIWRPILYEFIRCGNLEFNKTAPLVSYGLKFKWDYYHIEINGND